MEAVSQKEQAAVKLLRSVVRIRHLKNAHLQLLQEGSSFVLALIDGDGAIVSTNVYIADAIAHLNVSTVSRRPPSVRWW